jgi:hypothetical protein
MRVIAAKNDNKKWGVYAKRAFGGAEQVYRYLGRYTHRVGIANSRLGDVRDDVVTFRTKNGKTVTVAPVEFIRRFLLHVLPARFVKFRHYGLFAPANVNTKLKRARALLASTATPKALDQTGREILQDLTADDAHRCPACGVGILRRTGVLPHESTLAVVATDPPDTS